jgi:CRP-like cAMP-binding protein
MVRKEQLAIKGMLLPCSNLVRVHTRFKYDVREIDLEAIEKIVLAAMQDEKQSSYQGDKGMSRLFTGSVPVRKSGGRALDGKLVMEDEEDEEGEEGEEEQEDQEQEVWDWPKLFPDGRFWGESGAKVKRWVKSAYSVLDSVPMFYRCNHQEKLALALKMVRFDYEGGEEIYSAGEASDYFYILLEGEVGLFEPLDGELHNNQPKPEHDGRAKSEGGKSKGAMSIAMAAARVRENRRAEGVGGAPDRMATMAAAATKSNGMFAMGLRSGSTPAVATGVKESKVEDESMLRARWALPRPGERLLLSKCAGTAAAAAPGGSKSSAASAIAYLGEGALLPQHVRPVSARALSPTVCVRLGRWQFPPGMTAWQRCGVPDPTGGRSKHDKGGTRTSSARDNRGLNCKDGNVGVEKVPRSLSPPPPLAGNGKEYGGVKLQQRTLHAADDTTSTAASSKWLRRGERCDRLTGVAGAGRTVFGQDGSQQATTTSSNWTRLQGVGGLVGAIEAIKRKDAAKAKARRNERGRVRLLNKYHSYQEEHVTKVLEERERCRQEQRQINAALRHATESEGLTTEEREKQRAGSSCVSGEGVAGSVEVEDDEEEDDDADYYQDGPTKLELLQRGLLQRFVREVGASAAGAGGEAGPAGTMYAADMYATDDEDDGWGEEDSAYDLGFIPNLQGMPPPNPDRPMLSFVGPCPVAPMEPEMVDVHPLITPMARDAKLLPADFSIERSELIGQGGWDGGQGQVFLHDQNIEVFESVDYLVDLHYPFEGEQNMMAMASYDDLLTSSDSEWSDESDGEEQHGSAVVHSYEAGDEGQGRLEAMEGSATVDESRRAEPPSQRAASPLIVVPPLSPVNVGATALSVLSVSFDSGAPVRVAGGVSAVAGGVSAVAGGGESSTDRQTPATDQQKVHLIPMVTAPPPPLTAEEETTQIAVEEAEVDERLRAKAARIMNDDTEKREAEEQVKRKAIAMEEEAKKQATEEQARKRAAEEQARKAEEDEQAEKA